MLLKRQTIMVYIIMVFCGFATKFRFSHFCTDSRIGFDVKLFILLLI